jgi:hypothetical protein
MRSVTPLVWPPSKANIDTQKLWNVALKSQGDNRLPPSPTKVQAFPGTNIVSLAWEINSVDQPRIAGFRIFQDTESKLVQSINDPTARSAVLPIADGKKHSFFVASVSAIGKQSLPVQCISQNAIILARSAGNLLPNPGFENNAVGAPVNSYNNTRNIGDWVCDDWAINNSQLEGINMDPAKFSVTQEGGNGLMRSGAFNLQMRLKAGVVFPNNNQWYGLKIESRRIPVKAGEVHLVGGYYRWDAQAFLPAGIAGIVRIGLLEVTNTGAVLFAHWSDLFAAQGGYALASITYAVPANVVALGVFVAGYIRNSSAAPFNTGVLYMDARWDDLFITPQLNLDSDVADGTTFRRLLHVNGSNVLSASTVLNTQGSIIPSQPIVINYTATTTSIALSWSQQSFLMADGSTLIMKAGSVSYTGLGANTRYNIFPYIRVSDGTLLFANGSPPPSGTNPQAVLSAQQNFDGRVSTDPLFITTPSSGTSGGSGGGGDKCPDGEELVEVRDRGVIKAKEVVAGDWIRGMNMYTGEDVYRRVMNVTSAECAAWRRIQGRKVSPCEPVWWEEKWTPAYKVPGSEFDGSVGLKMQITVEADNYDQSNYWLLENGSNSLLIHNYYINPC